MRFISITLAALALLCILHGSASHSWTNPMPVYPGLQDRSVTLSQQPQYLNAASLPTRVYISLWCNALNQMSPITNTFFTDSYIYVTWRDDRLSNLARQTAVTASLFTNAANTYWWPRVEIMNLYSASSTTWSFSVEYGLPAFVHPSDVPLSERTQTNMTWVVAWMRPQMSLDISMDLHDFPFDTQAAGFAFESNIFTNSQVVFISSAYNSRSMFPSLQNNQVPGWNVINVSWANTQTYYFSFNQTYDRLTIALFLQRSYEYYANRFVLGPAFFVVMGFCAFFSPATDTGRIGMIGASFCGIVAWIFPLVASSPPLGYSTRLDLHVLNCMLFSLIQFIYASLRIGLHKRCKRWTGEEVDPKDTSADDAATPPLYMTNKIRTNDSQFSGPKPRKPFARKAMEFELRSPLDAAPLPEVLPATPSGEEQSSTNESTSESNSTAVAMNDEQQPNKSRRHRKHAEHTCLNSCKSCLASVNRSEYLDIVFCAVALVLFFTVSSVLLLQKLNLTSNFAVAPVS